MHDAIIEPMFPNLSIDEHKHERFCRVIIIQRNEIGGRIENNPNEITWRLNLTYDEAFSAANDYNQESNKRRWANQKPPPS